MTAPQLLLDLFTFELKDFNIGLWNDEAREARIQICQACENFQPTTNTCGICNCSISFMVMMRSKDCVIGKWISDDPNDPTEDAQNKYGDDTQ